MSHHTFIFNRFTIFALLASLIASAVAATPAHAASLTVNSDADAVNATDNACTLREAITAANNNTASGAVAGECIAGSGADTITFAGTYIITLGSQLPPVISGSTITITGNGAASTIVQANGSPSTANYRLFQVSSGGNLTLDGVTVRNGQCNGSCTVGLTAIGGAILNQGSLTVRNSTFSQNQASTFAGAIFSSGVLTVANSTFSGNSASTSGGAILNNGGTATVTGSTFSANSAGNSGGAILNNTGSSSITNSTFSANSVTTGGGGGLINNGGTSTITSSTFSANSAASGGGINNALGTLNYTNTLVANSSSGGDCVNSATLGTNSSNLVEDNSCSAGLSGDPNLGSLANNGGSTQTHALLAGSIAIDAGSGCSSPDQRGVARPQGSACDIGAFEYVSNAPTVAITLATYTVNEQTALNLHGTGISVADADGGSLTVTVAATDASSQLTANVGTTGVVIASGNGTPNLTLTGTIAQLNDLFAGNQGGTLTYRLEDDTPVASVTLTITANDGSLSGNDTAVINITSVNDAPTVANPIPDQNATVNVAFNFQFAANTFSDPDVSDTLTYSAQLAGGGALPAWLSFNAATRTFSGTPAAGDAGTISIDVIANDGNGGTVTDTFNITVNPAAPTNPTITSAGTTNADGTYMAGGVILVTVTFDQAVNVDTSGGTPSILLETGTTDRAATYTSGSGSNTLTFTYTVQPGDATPDLDYQSTAALALNGGTILSGSSQPAILTLPTPGGASSIAGQHAIVIDGVTFGVSATSLSSSYTTGPLTFTVSFNDDASDPAGNANTDDVTNPNNYLLVEDGANGVFNTQSCLGGVVSDDTQITASSVTYVSRVATVTLSTTPPVGTYRLFVCGTTSIVDLAGNPIAGNGSTSGTDYIFNFVVATSTPTTTTTTTVSTLPLTGFAPNRVTSLPQQPADLAYTTMSDIWLEVPSINVKTNIVGVPQAEKNWDVTWLGRDAGWLNGTAFPSWEGNSVVTAHVTDANGKPGPFANIKDMKYGDKIIVHMYGEKYIFEVQATRMVKPSSTQYAFKHLEDFAYLTLITCQGYDPSSESYLYRRIVRAVLVDVQSE